jgi:hypothetical protein
MIGRILWTCSKGPLKAPCGNPHESQNNVNVFEGRCKDLGDPSQGQLTNTQRHMASLFWISRRMLPRTRIGGEGYLRAPKDIRNGVGVHQPIIITLRGLAQEERAMRDRLRVVVPAFDQTAHEIGIARQLLVARAEFRSRGDNVEEDIRLERAAGEVLPAEAVAPAQPVQVREGYLRVLRKRQEHRDLVLEEEDFDDVREVAVSRAVARTVQSPNSTARLNRRRFRNFGWVARTTRLNLRDGSEPCIRISEPLLKYHFYKSEFNANNTAEIACF